MEPKGNITPRHESVDHQHPTDAGLMNDGDNEVPGTDIMGDETLVRSTGKRPPGIAPGSPSGTGAAPDAGPTREEDLDRAVE